MAGAQLYQPSFWNDYLRLGVRGENDAPGKVGQRRRHCAILRICETIK